MKRRDIFTTACAATLIAITTTLPNITSIARISIDGQDSVSLVSQDHSYTNKRADHDPFHVPFSIVPASIEFSMTTKSTAITRTTSSHSGIPNSISASIRAPPHV